MGEFLNKIQQSTFKGILTWEHLDELWALVLEARGSGWYAYTVGQEVPQRPAYGQELSTFIRDVNALLRHLHRQAHCGMVYVDDRSDPRLILIYHPQKVGGCGLGNGTVLPSWTISREIPENLQATPQPSRFLTTWQKLADYFPFR